MMALYEADLLVVFPDSASACCDIITRTSNGFDLAFGEALLLCMYTSRMLVNADPQIAASLASALQRVTPDALNFGDMKLLPDIQSKPAKRFKATLSVFSDVSPYFKLKPKGFGRRGVGLEFYGPESVGVTAEYVAKRFEGGFNELAANTMNLCGDAYRSGSLTIASQKVLSVQICEDAFKRARER